MMLKDRHLWRWTAWRKAGTKAEKTKDVAEVLAMARVLEQAGQLGIQARGKQKDRMSRLAGKEKTKERAKARKARRAKENRCRREKESVWRQTFAGSVEDMGTGETSVREIRELGKWLSQIKLLDLSSKLISRCPNSEAGEDVPCGNPS